MSVASILIGLVGVFLAAVLFGWLFGPILGELLGWGEDDES